MAHYTKVYGYINGPTWKTEDFYKLHRLNEKAIFELPKIDTIFPFINRSMFSIPDEQGIFREQIITFGASYKNLEYGWNLWLEKFESILKTLYWWEAKIYVDFEVVGQYIYEWDIDLNESAGNLWTENPKPIKKWTFRSDGPRIFFDE